MRSTAFFKLYKICILLHRCNLKSFAKNRFEKSAIFVKIQQQFCKCRKICKILQNFRRRAPARASAPCRGRGTPRTAAPPPGTPGLNFAKKKCYLASISILYLFRSKQPRNLRFLTQKCLLFSKEEKLPGLVLGGHGLGVVGAVQRFAPRDFDEILHVAVRVLRLPLRDLG